MMLPPNEVHLWSASLDETNPAEYAAFKGILDPTEFHRAGRFHFARDQRRFTLARGILRTLLAHYLATSPVSLVFGYTPRGKPHLSNPAADLRFNLSHSGGAALFAFARDREVGVDLEAGERLGDDWPLLARRFFSTPEQDELFAIPTAQQRPAFLDGWTRKEAYLKATGAGIADGLQNIRVTLSPERPPAFLSPEIAARWALYDPRSRTSAALVVERKNDAEPLPTIQRFSMPDLAALLGHQHR